MQSELRVKLLGIYKLMHRGYRIIIKILQQVYIKVDKTR